MDIRDQAAMRGGAPEKLVITIYNDDSDEIEIELPQKFDVCHVCEGKGTHVNPSIDSNGISQREFDEDPDFAESYWRGDYDVQCYECHGLRVVPVVDEDSCDPDLIRQWRQHQREEAEFAAEMRMEY